MKILAALAGLLAAMNALAAVTCRNASGHGWFLSRQHSRLF